MILVTEFYSVALGQAIGALSPSIFIASTVNPFLLVIFSLFCGVTIPQPQLPGFWRQWMVCLFLLYLSSSSLVFHPLIFLPLAVQPRSLHSFDQWIGQHRTARPLHLLRAV